jgi:predicted nucleotidyltransferase
MIDPRDVAAIIRVLRTAAAAHRVRFFLLGAFARDLRLAGTTALHRLRQTKDVDFAVMVPDQATCLCFREHLVARPERDLVSLPIDFVPFGSWADPDGSITLPPDGSSISVIGFDDADAHATEMTVAGERVRVVTVPGLVTLKLLAWGDNPDRTKDAEDVAFVLEDGRYLGLPGQEHRFWAPPDDDLVEEPDYDWELSAARLLGRDAARQCGRRTRHALEALLQRADQPPYALAAAMSRFVESGQLERAVALLRAFRRGFVELEPTP